MILVTGGTGQLGGRVVAGLVAAGTPVRVLTREAERAAHLAGPLVEVIAGDLRDRRSVERAVRDVSVAVSAAHGFVGAHQSPRAVDRDGNINLIRAASAAGCDVVLMSVVGAGADSPIDLFRAKWAAERFLMSSGVRWTIVRSTAFMETWAQVLGEPLRAGGQGMVFGRGRNPINFVSARDVAALVERAVLDSSLRGEILEIGGPTNVAMSDFVHVLEQVLGASRRPRRIPRPLLKFMGALLRPIKPDLARQVRAAFAMDVLDMTFDGDRIRRRFPDLPETPLRQGVEDYWRAA